MRRETRQESVRARSGDGSSSAIEQLFPGPKVRVKYQKRGERKTSEPLCGLGRIGKISFAITAENLTSPDAVSDDIAYSRSSRLLHFFQPSRRPHRECQSKRNRPRARVGESRGRTVRRTGSRRGLRILPMPPLGKRTQKQRSQKMSPIHCKEGGRDRDIFYLSEVGNLRTSPLSYLFPFPEMPLGVPDEIPLRVRRKGRLSPLILLRKSPGIQIATLR